MSEQQERKPTFLEVKSKHGANLGDIFEASGLRWVVNMRDNTLYRMFNNWPVRRFDAQMVIDGFNKRYQTSYTLDDLDIPLYPAATQEEIIAQLGALNEARTVLFTSTSRSLQVRASERIEGLFNWFEQHAVDVEFCKEQEMYCIKCG